MSLLIFINRSTRKRRGFVIQGERGIFIRRLRAERLLLGILDSISC